MVCPMFRTGQRAKLGKEQAGWIVCVIYLVDVTKYLSPEHHTPSPEPEFELTPELITKS